MGEIISDDDLIGSIKKDIASAQKVEPKVTVPTVVSTPKADTILDSLVVEPKQSTPIQTPKADDLLLGLADEPKKPAPTPVKAEEKAVEVELPEAKAPISDITSGLSLTPASEVKEVAAPQTPIDIFSPQAEKFDLSPARISDSIAVVIVGDKGSGKTTLVFNPKFFPGRIAAITMDEMTQHIWREIYKSDARITIYDGLRYYNPTTSDEIVETASKSLQYLSLLLIQEIENKNYDWILWDCSEELQEICEMAMRKDAGFKAKDGVPWQYWRLRNMHMDNIFNKSLKVARKGVIFTLYTGYRDVRESGEVMNTVKEIKWAGNLKTQSLVIIETSKRVTSEGKRYYMSIESSKVPSMFKETISPQDITIKF